MFRWLKKLLRKRRAVKKFKRAVKSADFERMIHCYEEAQTCKHAVRIAKNLNKDEEEVRCLHCGLIKIIQRLKN